MAIVKWDSVNKGTSVTLSNGDLTALVPNSNNTVRATEGKTNGKWYLEIKLDALNNAMIGIVNDLASLSSTNYSTSNARYYYSNGTKYAGGIAYGASYSTGDIISILLDLGLGTIEFWKNGVPQGVAFTDILSMGKIYPAITSGSSSSGANVTALFNVKEFTYRMPDGYLAYDGSSYINSKILLLSNEKTYKVEMGKISDVNAIPVMTSNTAPIGVVSASSENSPAWRATDDTTSDWIPIGGTVANSWWQYKFVSPIVIQRYSITVGSNLARTMKSFILKASNDGINWVDIDVRSNLIWSTAVEEKIFEVTSNKKEYLYYRIHIVEGTGDAFLAIRKIKMFEAIGNTRITQLLPFHSEQNLIKYGMNSPVQLDGIFESKNYILQDTVSENEDGLWTTQLNRKPLSIRFD